MERLEAYRSDNPLVLAIPRGGVPLAAEVAKKLDADLDVLLVHKIGAENNPEYAVGSVAESGKIQELESLADKVIVLDVPQPFYSVGEFYEDFSQVSDGDMKLSFDQLARGNT